MAAKLEEPLQPNYDRMVRLVKNKFEISLEKRDLLFLEEGIIKSLDFDLRYAGPIPFLERYLRIFNLDLSANDQEAFTISYLAHSFFKMIIRSPIYLSMKPSLVAAALLTLAVNLSTSPIVTELGFAPL